MKQYGLIGEKLGHSLSVPITRRFGRKLSGASYRLMRFRAVNWRRLYRNAAYAGRLQYHRAVQDGRDAPAG